MRLPTNDDADHAFDSLCVALRGKRLPVNDYPAPQTPTREASASEFMLMHITDRDDHVAYHFKHSDTRNYVVVRDYGGRAELRFNRTSKAFQRGGFRSYSEEVGTTTRLPY